MNRNSSEDISRWSKSGLDMKRKPFNAVNWFYSSPLTFQPTASVHTKFSNYPNHLSLRYLSHPVHHRNVSSSGLNISQTANEGETSTIRKLTGDECDLTTILRGIHILSSRKRPHDLVLEDTENIPLINNESENSSSVLPEMKRFKCNSREYQSIRQLPPQNDMEESSKKKQDTYFNASTHHHSKLAYMTSLQLEEMAKLPSPRIPSHMHNSKISQSASSVTRVDCSTQTESLPSTDNSSHQSTSFPIFSAFDVLQQLDTVRGSISTAEKASRIRNSESFPLRWQARLQNARQLLRGTSKSKVDNSSTDFLSSNSVIAINENSTVNISHDDGGCSSQPPTETAAQEGYSIRLDMQTSSTLTSISKETPITFSSSVPEKTSLNQIDKSNTNPMSVVPKPVQSISNTGILSTKVNSPTKAGFTFSSDSSNWSDFTNTKSTFVFSATPSSASNMSSPVITFGIPVSTSSSVSDTVASATYARKKIQARRHRK